VAVVAVDTPLAHLDRPFDYLVPAGQHDDALPGVRVRVRFSGRLVGGYLLERRDGSEHDGRLSFLDRVVSPEPVLPPASVELCRGVADRMAGTFADVVRLAVPPRHARVEAEPRRAPPPVPDPPAPTSWARYPGGPQLLAGLASGAAVRLVWATLPGPGVTAELAAAVTATLAADRGVVAVLPERDAAERLLAALPAGQGVLLAADLGPAARYRAFLAALRGSARAVVGTRAAAFAPVPRLGLILVYDDGSDAHRDPHAPYPHARDVALARAHAEGAAVILAGPAISVEAAALVESRWATGLRASRDQVRLAAPRVEVAGSDAELARDPAARAARLPSLAWRTAGRGLEDGPVLVQVPRRGYQSALACAQCRAPAHCPACAGPLRRGIPGRDPGGSPAADITRGPAGTAVTPSCCWCARPAADWVCRECSARGLRAGVVGAARTAEELGRSFPGVPVRHSAGDHVLGRVGPEPALVVATPGAEPFPEGAGYTAALLLDGWLLLGRADLRASEEAFRRWANALALCRPGARAVILADPSAPAVAALVRWDPTGLASREAGERSALHFPPAARMAAVSGPPSEVNPLLAAVELPAGGELLGPVSLGGDSERWLLRVPRASGAALAAELKAALAARSARRAGGRVRVEMDPSLDL
jgi:primosomal protein N' (replication factor Y)